MKDRRGEGGGDAIDSRQQSASSAVSPMLHLETCQKAAGGVQVAVAIQARTKSKEAAEGSGDGIMTAN